MAGPVRNDGKAGRPARAGADGAERGKGSAMTAFVESCVETAAGRAVMVEKESRHRPRARRLLRALKDKKNILITTHVHPDPDALASSYALCQLLSVKLPEAKLTHAVKGNVGSGYNRALALGSDLRPVQLDDVDLKAFDAVILLDVQPQFKSSPLPENVIPTAVIDHHRTRGRRAKFDFVDVRTDVGATSSIIFSYYMELEVDIGADLAAMLLFAIETDLAGAAGQPGELDNMALSSLTLLADTRKLYKMRYVDLPQTMYVSMARGLANAIYYDNVMISHLETIDSMEAPAVLADFLLRFEKVEWVLVSGVSGDSLVMSLRTSSAKGSAADVMRRLVRKIGEGGGHRTKAGGGILLTEGTAAEIERIRGVLKKRLLRALGVANGRGMKLVG